MPINVASLQATLDVEDTPFYRTTARAEERWDRLTENIRKTGEKAAAGAFGAFPPQVQKAVQSITETLALLTVAVRRMVDRVRTAFTVLHSGFKTVQEAAGHLYRAFTTLAAPVARLTGLVGGLAGAGGFAGLLASMTAVGRRGFEFNLQLGAVRNGLETLLGSGQSASAVLDQLQKDAASTVFSFGELAEQTKKLIAFGFAPGEARRVVLASGNAATALAGEEGPNALLDRLTLALGQMRAKGKVTGEEGMQLAEAGIPVRDFLRVPQGKDIADMNLSAAQGIPRILAGMEGRFGGLMAKGMSGWGGITSNIGDVLDAISSRATKALSESLRKGAASVLETLTKLQDNKSLMGALTMAFTAFGRAVEWAGSRLGGFVEWLQRIVTQRNLTQFLSRVVAFVQTITTGLVTLAGIDLGKLAKADGVLALFEGLGRTVEGLVNGVFAVVRGFQGVMAAGREVGPAVAAIFTQWSDRVEDFLTDLRLGFRRTLLEMAERALKFVYDLRPTLDGIGKTLTTAVGNALKAIVNDIFENYKRAFSQMPIIGDMVRAQLNRVKPLQMEPTPDITDASGRPFDPLGYVRRQREALEREAAAERQGRLTREKMRTDADPRYREGFLARLAGAYRRGSSDMGPQVRFWQAFERNRAAAARFFTDAAMGVDGPPIAARSGVPGAVPPSEMLTAAGRRAGTVQTVPALGSDYAARMQAFIQQQIAALGRLPLNQQEGAARDLRGLVGRLGRLGSSAATADPFAPVRLPDGSVISQTAVNLREMLNPQVNLGPETTRVQRGPGGATQIVINLPPSTPADVGRRVQEELERLVRETISGPTPMNW